MAGIKGMPTARPNNLEQPVPGASQDISFEDFAAEHAKQAGQAASNIPAQTSGATPSFEEFAAQYGQTGQGQAAPQEVAGYQGPGSEVLKTVADWAPTAGAIAGGIAGLPADIATGGLASIGGAAAGGMAGNSVKRLIEAHILGMPKLDTSQELYQGAKTAIQEGLGQAAGLGIAKGATSLAATKVGAAVVDGVADVFAKPLAQIGGYLQGVRDAVEQPVMKLIASKVTPLNIEESGNAVKQLFDKDINTRFGKFVKSYETLDSVAKEMPVFDATKPNFFVGDLKSWAADNFSGDSKRMLTKVADDFAEVSNGKQFSDLIKQVNGEVRHAYSQGRTAQGEALKQLRDKAESFFEDKTVDLAKRISEGKGSMQEMDAFGKMMAAQQNPSVAPEAKNLVDYTKSVAKDYLKDRSTVKNSYAKFRGFLSDIGEQTKISTESRGPLQFLKDIQEVPSEKLVERMFDPKNAAALRTMQIETPEVFDQVVKSKMSQLVEKATPIGSPDVSLPLLRSNLAKLPTPTRNLLLSSEDYKMLEQAINDPKVKALDALSTKAKTSIIGLAAHGAEIARMTVKAVGDSASNGLKNSPMARQVVGKTTENIGSGFVNAFRGNE